MDIKKFKLPIELNIDIEEKDDEIVLYMGGTDNSGVDYNITTIEEVGEHVVNYLKDYYDLEE